MILISSSRLKLIGVCFAILFSTLQATPVTANFILRMQTDLGGIDIEMFDTVAPQTVANFMNYVNDGDYDGTFFHRSIPGFVVQGGGFIANTPDGSILSADAGASHIPTDPPVVNEFNLSNLRGTIAMAKVGGDPDSATSEWFFNLDDNSANLDVQNDGFTVFAQVLNEGMDVVDAIAALQRCVDVAPFPQLCQSFPDVPFAGNEDLSNAGLINVLSIGFDNDGDGAIDSLEDAAPNNGDGNNDAILDSTQQSVASFRDEAGDYVVIETQATNPLQSLDILGVTFAIANPDTTAILDDLEFTHGYFGFDITNATPGDNTASVTLLTGALPGAYFNFGPTPDDADPHWYEFTFDGVTGAEFNGNIITLHYVDGLRGDADLAQDGIITATRGGPANVDSDGDGITDFVEDGAPNNGDANNDGIEDKLQQNVASFPDEAGEYVVIETQPASPLASVDALGASFALANPDTDGILVDREFTHGYFEFDITNATPGDNTASVTLPAKALAGAYYNFGPTPEDANPHWYEFTFDGVTGAEFNGNIITLHYVDGLRGDSDLSKDGTITAATGGPARITGDGDGIPDDVEDGAPNKGDGNNDGLPDKQQPNVTSLVDVVSGEYITIEAESSMRLKNIGTIDGSNVIAQSVTGDELNGLNFAHGFLRYEVLDVTPGADVSIKLYMNSTKRPVKYFKFGPTPDNPVDHFYEFDFDGETGAEFNGNVITLHFVDGKRGDADLTANGIIVDPGTPAIKAVNTGSSSGGSSGGGCSINPSENHPGRAVGWLLLGLFILLLGAYRKAYRH